MATKEKKTKLKEKRKKAIQPSEDIPQLAIDPLHETVLISKQTNDEKQPSDDIYFSKLFCKSDDNVSCSNDFVIENNIEDNVFKPVKNKDNSQIQSLNKISEDNISTQICEVSTSNKNVVFLKSAMNKLIDNEDSNTDSLDVIISSSELTITSTAIHKPSFLNLQTEVDRLKTIQPEENVSKNSTVDLEAKINKNEQLLSEQKILNSEIEENILPLAKIPSVSNVSGNIKEEPINFQSVKPFTEVQLSSLYNNFELELNDGFVKEFLEIELKHDIAKHHHLYELLLSYLRARTRMTHCINELRILSPECTELQSQLWTLEKVVTSERGECRDGNIVTAVHEYHKAKFHTDILSNLLKKLTIIRELVNETFTLHAYSVEMLKLQIENYIQSVTSSCISNEQLAHNSNPKLISDEHSIISTHLLNELKQALSVLFSFQRRPLADSTFVEDTHRWIERLTSVLVRFASWREHMFILHHILRCPAGVTKWAANLIQVPCPIVYDKNQMSPFSNPYVHHCVSVLAAIMLPVTQRDAFLTQMEVSSHDVVTEQLWVLVDSEGEEDNEENLGSLNETDVINLLDQIPFANLFRVMLGVNHQDQKDVWESKDLSEHHILRLIAWSSLWLRLLGRGLHTYSSPRYRQLAKFICRLIRHTVQYLTDVWQDFSEHKNSYDQSMMLRLQVEYDGLLTRTTQILLCARPLGASQFLADIPYNKMSLPSLWHLFYILHCNIRDENLHYDPCDVTDYKNKVEESSTQLLFEERLSEMTDQEVYYLLQTFASMVLARSKSEWEFIRIVTLDLLRIGFLSSTQESYSKPSRDLLSSITANYPSLISDILIIVKENFSKIGQLGCYLFKGLPVHLWAPSEIELNVIHHWILQFSPNTPENNLARLILSHLNWDYRSDGSLFLSHKIHIKIALLLVAASYRHCTVNSNAIGPWSEWAWRLWNRLRLHATDIGAYNSTTLIERVREIPELENCDVLHAGVKDKHSFACAVALLVTQWGHSIPLVCTQGFQLINSVLLQDKHYSSCIVILNHLVPLFINCQDSLFKSEGFINILSTLLSADQTYVKAAKSLISFDTPGPVLKNFSSMIQNQLDNHKYYGLNSSKEIVSLWLRALSHIQDWACNSSILYLMDIILRSAFFDPESVSVTYQILCDVLKQQSSDVQVLSGTLSSLLTWVAGGSVPSPTLLNARISVVWYALFALDIEHTELEKKSGLWNELLRLLAKSTGKTNIDVSLKKASNNMKVPFWGSNMLSLYRWAQQALDAPFGHPALPLIWQKFFFLFLARVPTQTGSDRGAVGFKFFDGMINLSFHKKLKKRLHETMEWYQAQLEAIEKMKSENETEETEENNYIYYSKCFQLFRCFSLWLEESRLQEPGLFLPALPPQYDSQKLTLIIEGNTEFWFEYVDFKQVEVNRKQLVNDWISLCQRDFRIADFVIKNSYNNLQPSLRIVQRLKSYEKPKSAPSLCSAAVVPPVSISSQALSNFNVLLNILKPQVQCIMEYAQNYCLRVSEHTALDCAFGELVPQLYRPCNNSLKLKSSCKGSGSNKKNRNSCEICSGPALICIKFTEGKVVESIERQIQNNRAEYEALLKILIQSPPVKFCFASVFLDYAVCVLQGEYMKFISQNDSIGTMKIMQISSDLFYYIISLMNDESNFCPPVKQLFTTCIDKLGQTFVSIDIENSPNLLKSALEKPNLTGLLAPHFSPLAASFIPAYKKLVKNLAGTNAGTPSPDVVFVLLSKFDVDQWLSSYKPRLSERTDFIELVLEALTYLGVEPSEDQLIIHEVLRRHLMAVFTYEWPEHYGEVLQGLLRASGGATGGVNVAVWNDLLHNLGFRDDLRIYATSQRLLTHHELLETSVLLSQHFMQERLQWGLHGLYPRYRIYVVPLMQLLSMIGHALVISSIQMQPGLLADKLCEQIWPALNDMWCPWVAPYWSETLKDCSATWIKQLTDDRNVILPWSLSDCPHAQYAVNSLVETVRFIINTLPASSNSLNFIWQFYATNFAHVTIKDHILRVLHAGLLTLPWEQFWPSLLDLELMMKVVDQYLPDCHVMVGLIIVRVPWSVWLSALSPGTALIKAHCCILPLFIKLAHEPSIQQNENLNQLLSQALKFSWNLVDVNLYEQLINWYIMSGDPRAVLPIGIAGVDRMSDELNHNILELLQTAAEYKPLVVPGIVSTETFHKQLIYVRALTRLLVLCASRYQHLLIGDCFPISIKNMLNYLEAVLSASLNTPDQLLAESALLVYEILTLVNDKFLSKVFISIMSDWLMQSTCETRVLRGSFKTIGSISNCPHATGELLEAVFEGFFNGYHCSWQQAINYFEVAIPRASAETFAKDGRVLTLHAIICRDNTITISDVIEYISLIKPLEFIESKILLIWDDALRLAISTAGETTVLTNVRHLAEVIISCIDERASGWGATLLGAIGIRKQYILSQRCRLMSQSLAAYILTQLGNESLDIRSNADFGLIQLLESIHSVTKQQNELKICAEYALKQIKNEENSLLNTRVFLARLGKQLYNQSYLHELGTE